MAELDSRFVQRGLWTNWDWGSVMGQTITTDTRTGTIIISLLAVLSTLALSHLWNLVTFAIHQARAHGRPSDGLYWQQQAILRTLPPPSSVCADNIKLWWNWRRHTKALRRCLPQVVIALLFLVASLVASVFTSFAVSTSNIEVLVSSPYCGEVNWTRIYGLGASDTPVDTFSYEESVSRLAQAYANECYLDDNPTAATCKNIFIQDRLPLAQSSAKCPFDSSICLGNDQAVTYDTGLLDLNTFLGTNLRSRDAVKFRKKTTCAVLKRDGHYTVLNATEGDDSSQGNYDTLSGAGGSLLPDEQLLVLFYGSFPDYSPSDDFANATFTQILSPRKRTYQGQSMQSLLNPLPGDSNLILLPELTREDADVTLISFFPSNMTYKQPVEDPIFSAHRPIEIETTFDEQRRYQSDYDFGIMGCAEQIQYCIARDSGPDFCTPLSGSPLRASASDGESFPGATPVQQAILQFLISTNRYYMVDVGMTIGLNASAAIQPIYNLPPNQWIIETTGFLRYQLAMLQRYFTDFAIGPQARHYSAETYVRLAATEGERQFCQSQKMRKAGGFANINLFALVFIVVVTCTILVLDFTFLRFLIFLSKFRRALEPRIDRWIQDGLLQLQRRAFEAQTGIMWEQLDQEVPLICATEKLPELTAQWYPGGNCEFEDSKLGYRNCDFEDSKQGFRRVKSPPKHIEKLQQDGKVRSADVIEVCNEVSRTPCGSESAEAPASRSQRTSETKVRMGDAC